MADKPNPRGSVVSGADAASLTPAALESIEQRYVEVMRALNSDPQLDAFKNEYEKIHRLLNKSHEGEKRLFGKVTELKTELGTHHANIENAMQLSQEDEQNIAALRAEIEKAWAMADTAHAREKESREMTQELKKQVADLDALVEQSAGLAMGQEAYLRDLLAARKSRTEELEVVSSKQSRLSVEHHDCAKRLSALEAKGTDAREELELRMAAYQALLVDLEGAQRERQAKEQSVREYRATTEQHVMDLDRGRVQVEALAGEESRLKKELAALADTVQNVARQLEERQKRFNTEAHRLSAVEQHNAELKKEVPKRAAALAEKQRELRKVEKTLRQAEKAARGQQEELSRLVVDRDTLTAETNRCGEDIDGLLTTLAQTEKEVLVLETALKKAMRDKSKTVTDNCTRENERAETEGRRVLEEGTRRRLAQELESLLSDNEKLRRKVFELEQVQNGELSAAQLAMLDHHKTLDHIRAKRSDTKALRDLLTMQERKHKAQQELLDRVTADRNRTEKQMKETDQEWSQLKTRHADKLEEIEQMKSQLISTEATLCQLHAVSKQLQRDTSNTEQRASHLREDGAHANNRIAALQAEATQLQQIIANCDAERTKQQMRLNAITNERNVLATQLLRRNDELRLLYEKIQLQQSALDKGALDYVQKVSEIVDSRDALVELRLQCRLVLVRLRLMNRLKRTEGQARRALVRERGRVRALVEELQSPVNVHRWRGLEGTSPALLDGIAKVQMLQKKLLAKTDECEAKVKSIEQKEVEYAGLRKRLARLPGPEAAEDLALFHENIEKREEQIAGMAVELQGVEQHAEVLAEEVRQLGEELAEVKRKYFAVKTKNDTLLREQRTLRQTWGGGSAAIAAVALSASRSAPPAHSSRGRGDDNDNDDGGGDQHDKGHVQQVRLSQQRVGWSGTRPQTRSGSTNMSTSERQQRIAKEEELMRVLTTGQAAPNYPLQKPKGQRQFVGGGFALTR